MKKLLVISAVWCGPCKAYHPILEEWHKDHPEVEIEYLDADDDSAAQKIEELGIRSVPTTVYYKDGEVVTKKFGLLTKDGINNLIAD